MAPAQKKNVPKKLMRAAIRKASQRTTVVISGEPTAKVCAHYAHKAERSNSLLNIVEKMAKVKAGGDISKIVADDGDYINLVDAARFHEHGAIESRRRRALVLSTQKRHHRAAIEKQAEPALFRFKFSDKYRAELAKSAVEY